LDIVIATFGDSHWRMLAAHRAAPSARPQGRVILSHGRTLAEARNAGLAEVRSEFCIFLDADDELEPGYVEAMKGGTADLRAPSVAYVRNGRRRKPYVPKVAGHEHDCGPECLGDGNWIVVGAAVRAEMLRRVGGWEEWPVYEDWAMWLRLWLAGASIERIPAAVYRAHWHPKSRNRAPSMDVKNAVHHQIVEAWFPAATA
jgi:cellulose synthase/poly-beta-1,6-N-acetylglucosamine synthase-like glycosyltransferase